MWESTFFPLTIEMLPEDFDLPPFATEPYRLRAAESWGCPPDEVASRIAVHLPDCGLCRE
eukprot:8664690-Alexandrium_andersonii.AAC.1